MSINKHPGFSTMGPAEFELFYHKINEILFYLAYTIESNPAIMNSRLFHKNKGLFDFNKTLIRLCKTFQTISAKYLRKNSF